MRGADLGREVGARRGLHGARQPVIGERLVAHVPARVVIALEAQRECIVVLHERAHCTLERAAVDCTRQVEHRLGQRAEALRTVGRALQHHALEAEQAQLAVLALAGVGEALDRLHVRREPRDRGLAEDRVDRHRQPELRRARCDAHRAQRIAAEREEVALDADLARLEYLLPDRGQRAFDVVARRDVAVAEQILELVGEADALQLAGRPLRDSHRRRRCAPAP